MTLPAFTGHLRRSVHLMIPVSSSTDLRFAPGPDLLPRYVVVTRYVVTGVTVLFYRSTIPLLPLPTTLL